MDLNCEEFSWQFNTIRLKMQINVKMEKISAKNDIRKWKFRKYKNFQGKNCLNSSSNDRRKYRILSTIQHNSIENANQGQNRRKEQKRGHWKEKISKICESYGIKLSKFEIKWQEKIQNFLCNSTQFDQRCKSRSRWIERAQKHDIQK